MNTSSFGVRPLQLPANFEWVRLGYVARLQNGLTVDAKRDVTGDVVTRPYLRVANVQAGSLNLDSVTEITVPRSTALRSTLRPGDVLMTEGGDLDKLGRGTVWQGELDECLHQNHIFAVRPDHQRLSGRFLAYVTQSLYGRYYFESTGTRTTNLASTNSSKIQSFPLPLPPLEGQRHIADFLDAETERLDLVADKRKMQYALLREKRFNVVREVLTQGLRGAPQRPTPLGWLPCMPADWTLVPLRYLVECLDGQRVPLSAQERSTRQGPHPYHGASRVVDHVDDYLFDEPLVLLGEDGAQLANPNLEVSFYVEGKIWVNNHAHVLRPRGINGRLLTEVLNVFDRNLYMSGATREKITQDEMNRILIPTPPDDQQRELIKWIADRHQDRERLERALLTQLELLGERRQALITAAVTGQFDVSTASGRNVTEGVTV